MDNNFDNENLNKELEDKVNDLIENGAVPKAETSEEKPEEHKPAEFKPTRAYTPPVQAPVGNPQAPQTPPQANPTNRIYGSGTNPSYYGQTPPVAFSGTGNGYTPYGYYERPVAPKKKSKNKKLGVVIAIVLISLAFLICTTVAVAVVTKGTISKNPTKPTETVSAEIPLQENKSDGDNATGASAIYKKVQQTNVGILIYSNGQSTIYSEGSGVILPTKIADGKNSNLTYIVTCAHVLEQSPSYKTVVQLYDGKKYDATIIGLDKKTDIGVVAIKATGLKAAEFASSESVSVGDTVYALGNPGGATFFGSFTNGMVSAIGRPVDSPVGYEVACVQHTAPINPGNSGGALLNDKGQVIGINSSKIASSSYEGMGFAVPSETVKEIVENLIEHGYVSNRAILGVTFYPSKVSQVHSVIIKTYNLPEGSVIINSITKNSDLASKDVKSGDMIIGYNGKDLDDYNDLMDYVEDCKVGDKLTLKICRIDQNYQISTFDVEVKLVEDTGELYSEETTEASTAFTFPFVNPNQ